MFQNKFKQYTILITYMIIYPAIKKISKLCPRKIIILCLIWQHNQGNYYFFLFKSSQAKESWEKVGYEFFKKIFFFSFFLLSRRLRADGFFTHLVSLFFCCLVYYIMWQQCIKIDKERTKTRLSQTQIFHFLCVVFHLFLFFVVDGR